MKDAQSNKLKMYDSVRMALNKHSAEWNGIPYLNNTITEFYAIIQEIIPTAVEQLNDIKAYGGQKKVYRNALQDSMYLCSSLIGAYALASQNQSLFDEVKMSKTSLIRRRDKILSFDAKELLGTITQHEAALALYGITPAVKADFEQKIMNFDNALNSPLQERKQNREATQKLTQIFAKADNLLRYRLDAQMLIYKESNSFLYTYYNQVRKIIHSPTIKLAMRVKTIDSQSKQPVKGALIKIKDHKINRKTSPLGQILIRNLKEGAHQIEITAPGYQPQTLQATRVKGKTVIATAELEIKSG